MRPLLETVRGQPTAVDTLRRALVQNRVSHAYLFDGPEGVGKERAAFGLAQALLCERRQGGGAEACGACSACTRAVPRVGSPDAGRPNHPDITVLERGLYDPATIGRRTPETQDISIDQVRTLVLARVAFAPYEGRARVLIIRRAEELSASAANALLKTLEEPLAKTHFVLLSASADALLPTIRSRTLRVRFGPLPEAVVAEILVELGVPQARAAEIAVLAAGSMAHALVLSDPETSAQRDDFVTRAMAAVREPDLGPALGLAEDAKKGDKATLIANLEALAVAFASTARAAVATPDRSATVAAERHGLAMTAIEQIESNAQAQLTVEAMLVRMRAV